jgi:diaminopimelate epimerase
LLIPFTKMHGLGNDYLFVQVDAPPADPGELARRMSSRHDGVGADGMILVLPPSGPKADVAMRIFNADGSEAEMCGNGLRCLVKLARERGLAAGDVVRVQTGAGVLEGRCAFDGAGRVGSVEIDMGEPVLDAVRVPVVLSGVERVVDHPADALDLPSTGGLEPRMTCVSMGNPHLVLFCAEPDAVPLATLGPRLETAPIFPRRINVHVVRADAPDALTMRTWERGSGLTRACGTGAAAVAVAAALTGRTGRAVTASLPGGELEIVWSEATGRVTVRGPAVEVFSGTWPA